MSRLLLLLPLLLFGLGLGCSEDGDQCPAEFKPGDPCEIVGLLCPPPTAECEDTLCVCSDEQAGGFVWDCSKVPYCKCTCFCGKIAVNTCEALGCTRRPQDPCPAKAAGVCAVVCADAGPPDAGPDLPRPDGRPDGPSEGPPDGPVEDQPRPDLVPDLPADQGLDGPGDQTVDLPGFEGSVPEPDQSLPDS